MTPPAPVTRRSLLRGGLALGATAGLARAASGCAYIPSETPAEVKLPKSAKAKIDGDLVYFNWADYLDPSVIKGFQRSTASRSIQSNFDSMEGMYAKIAGRQPVRHRLPDRQVGAEDARARARSARSTTPS